GAGSVASDGLTMGNVVFNSHSFRIGAARVGADSFLGTDVYVPPGARLGAKVMAPIDGPLRENVGLLGSPAFEIPRASARDLELVGRLDEATRARALREKTRHNVATMLMTLARRFAVGFVGLY